MLLRFWTRSCCFVKQLYFENLDPREGNFVSFLLTGLKLNNIKCLKVWNLKKKSRQNSYNQIKKYINITSQMTNKPSSNKM